MLIATVDMRLVLDASVAVAAARPSEPSHGASRARVNRALQGNDELVLPSLFLVEVAGALARSGASEAAVRKLLERLTASPHEVVSIGPNRALRAVDVAIDCKLRGADALYVWLAAHERVPFCTLDDEVRKRAARLCSVIAP